MIPEEIVFNHDVDGDRDDLVHDNVDRPFGLLYWKSVKKWRKEWLVDVSCGQGGWCFGLKSSVENSWGLQC